MATYQKHGGRWRAIIRKHGHRPVSKSFRTKCAALRRAAEVEDALESLNVRNPRALETSTIDSLIDRYAELTRLHHHWKTNDRREIPMHDIMDFAVASTWRLSEITQVERADLDRRDKTVIIRDRKGPRKKITNNQEVALHAGHKDWKRLVRYTQQEARDLHR